MTNKKTKSKRKSKTSKKTISETFKYELYGLGFILLAVFGSGAWSLSEGIIPLFLVTSFRFLFGFWYSLIPLSLLALGLYMMIKQRFPDFFSRRFLGLFIFLVSLMLLTHALVYREWMLTHDLSIIGHSFDQFNAYRQGEMTSQNLGGGMVGAILLSLTYKLLSLAGSVFLAVFLMIISFVFMFDFSLKSFFEYIINKASNAIQFLKEKKQILTRKSKEREQTSATQKSKQKQQSEAKVEIKEPVIEDFTDVHYHDDASEAQGVFPFSDIEEKQLKNTNHDNDKASIKTDGVTSDIEKEAQVEPMTEKENMAYVLPPVTLLEAPAQKKKSQEKGKIQEIVRKLETTFESFGVKAKVTRVHVGPAVTKYEVYPEAGVKVSKIVNLHDDLALALAAKDIRIEAPIPGKSAVGIEVPNQEVSMVTMREVFEAKKLSDEAVLSFILGRDISGEAVVHELNKMPHLLVAGATGSGKSVCINGIIISILMRAKPHQVKLMMIDPKKVELNVYNGIPHLLTPVVTDPKKAAQALKKVVNEMERRYDLFSDTGNRNIEGYNNYIKKYNQTVDTEEEEQPLLPYIVVLVDELADLMMVASNEVEDAITRLAQMARAAGIHLIIATQRPSVDVITGVIKANIPSRIAFSVSSQTDSRTILDSGGAEKLLGRGDMLFMPVGASKPTRIQGAFLSDEEVEAVVDYCIEQQKANYQAEMIPDEVDESKASSEDVLYPEAVQLVVEMQTASVSMLQRRFRIGYNRAARLIDEMEANNIVGPHEGSKPRIVLMQELSD
ncbi:DNA segregation ATPase FtsK/SpoIIIE, S-DNA-T family [Halolactibacillus halophilus]|uniref:DNA segregation ATPase FtsK/SpoIIIE, S-DNA-T family n=1 Tax=Halolactibacillus halophilus TaxID=306540 RepID=A0A1I5LHK1_9BACI|nr:DNA translocase FtsK [Halolactibacillus halophilus]GEM00821.1 DNA translocase FtsK [Halolactibacillus halophilus]SFO96673.1 DNA segregation ATPase FtsK/SpoIIIE, S-DNA-T family [Halolactibacillus halophilus]